MEASQLRSRAYANMVAKRRDKRREWREIDEDIRSRWASNLIRYKSLLFNQKNEFAQEENPAIYIGKTAIKMPDGSAQWHDSAQARRLMPKPHVAWRAQQQSCSEFYLCSH